MGSMLAFTLAAIASIGLLLVATGIALFRLGNRALAYWLHGWSALLASAFVALLLEAYPAIYPVGFLFSSFVPPFMVLGAAVHAGREEPTWLIPTSLLVAALRIGAYLLGAFELAMGLAMVVEVALATSAAWLVGRPAHHPPRPLATADRLLVAGFLLYGAIEGLDASTRLAGRHGPPVFAAWLAVGLPLATIQIAVSLDRMGRRARRYEDDARANAVRLQALSETSHDFLLEFDDQGVLTYVSPSSATIVGHASEALIGRNVFEFEPPAPGYPLSGAIGARGRMTAEDVAAAVGSAHPVVLPNGEARWFEFVGTTYRTLEGALRIVARVSDVTARTERHDALRRSEARLRRAERIAGVGSWELDPATDRMVFSDEMLRIHGLPRGDGNVSVETARALVLPEDREAAIARSIETREHGRPTDLVYRIRRADDGEIRTLHVFSEADVDAAGRVVRLVGATQDITEQIELTSRLRQGQERFQSLVDSNIVAVFFAGRDGAITEANGAFLELLGCTKGDLPLDWRRLTVPGFRDACDPPGANAAADGATRSFEHEFYARDGRRVPMLLSFVRMSADAVIAIGVDLRERKHAEADRARYQRELEDTVAMRTRELLESRTRLIEREKLAVVGTLAAGVAHQINNPIGAILNCAEYALMCRDDEDARPILERALRDNLVEARRCAQIVRSMLQFSRDQPTAKWIEDLNRVARRAQRAISAYAKDREATIGFSTEDENLFARISPIEIEQAIVNVLRNAIESRPSGVHVSLRLSRRDKLAVLEITDDGRGIEPAHVDRLFEPFFSTRTREGGTGLGLSVAHGIVVDHGGQIRIESVPEIGTRVVVTLPIAEAERDGGIGPFAAD